MSFLVWANSFQCNYPFYQWWNEYHFLKEKPLRHTGKLQIDLLTAFYVQDSFSLHLKSPWSLWSLKGMQKSQFNLWCSLSSEEFTAYLLLVCDLRTAPAAKSHCHMRAERAIPYYQNCHSESCAKPAPVARRRLGHFPPNCCHCVQSGCWELRWPLSALLFSLMQANTALRTRADPHAAPGPSLLQHLHSTFVFSKSNCSKFKCRCFDSEFTQSGKGKRKVPLGSTWRMCMPHLLIRAEPFVGNTAPLGWEVSFPPLSLVLLLCFLVEENNCTQTLPYGVIVRINQHNPSGSHPLLKSLEQKETKMLLTKQPSTY